MASLLRRHQGLHRETSAFDLGVGTRWTVAHSEAHREHVGDQYSIGAQSTRTAWQNGGEFVF